MMKKRIMKIGISGGGPAGLTFAAILKAEAAETNTVYDITIFERGSGVGTNQGSGWDMDAQALMALRRAGVDPSSLQRPGSDTMRFYKLHEENDNDLPLYVMKMPSVLESVGLKKEQIGLDEINCETERKKLIDGLLSSLGLDGSNTPKSPHVRIQHDCYVADAKQITIKNTETDDTDTASTHDNSGIELFDREGVSLGEYDLVVDASGVNSSSLRHLRFKEDADAVYTGTTFIQFNVKSPEQDWDETIVQRLGEGTLGVYGPTADGTGTLGVFAQRYGANIKDQMTNISIQIYTEDPNQVASDLGCQGLHGYLNQEDIVKKAVEYAKHTLLAHQDWPDKYRAMFDATDGVRVLPIYMHPSSVKVSNGEKNGKTATDTSGNTWNEDLVVPGSEQIPFIGIGDALHALPPSSGMSGNFALRDAADLATALLAEQKKDPSSNTLATMLRNQEQIFVQRTEDRRQHTIEKAKFGKDYDSSTTVHDFDWISSVVIAKPFSWTDPGAVCIAGYLRTLTFLNRWDNYGILPLSKSNRNSNSDK